MVILQVATWDLERFSNVSNGFISFLCNNTWHNLKEVNIYLAILEGLV